MADIALDCPHCFARNTGFELTWNREIAGRPGLWAVVAVCRRCSDFVMLRASHVPNRHDPTSAIEAIERHGLSAQVQVLACYPLPQTERIIDHLPANVSSALHEAEVSYLAGQPSAAAAMYRKTMERALGHMLPDKLEKKTMLADRIRAAERAMAMPQAMLDWANEVRLFGNQAAHDDDDPTMADAAEARDFVHLFLIYAFDLPERVRLAKARRQAN